MIPYSFHTTVTEMLSDVYTPVGIYLRLRDSFRDPILLESAQQHTANNNYSIIGLQAIAGIEITDTKTGEYKLPGRPAKKIDLTKTTAVAALSGFLEKFSPKENEHELSSMAQGVFGYCAYDAVQLFEQINFNPTKNIEDAVPFIRYRLYQYVIIVDHFHDKLIICENHFDGIPSQKDSLLTRILNRDIPAFPFQKKNELIPANTEEQYKDMVLQGIDACKTGEVFQVVLSRKFRQEFIGDDFNVYRSLRSINPSPYLFYFDYGAYKIAGSSPEAQVIVKNGKIIMHPIAGTISRTGNAIVDTVNTEALKSNEKENAEHTMLVDLARNDLSKISNQVHVAKNKEVQEFSHVIHLVSEVCGTVKENAKPFDMLGATFPAGTLSGAPKYRAMQIIDELETEARGFYGGIIGFIGFNGEINHAIIIRSFLSRNNTIELQAGAGVVAASTPDGELEEVNNKLNALIKALAGAEKINK